MSCLRLVLSHLCLCKIAHVTCPLFSLHRGEIDAESIIFFDADSSPSGKAAVLFAGAWSSTTSFWEFDCGEEEMMAPPSDPSGDPSAPDESKTVKDSAATMRGFLSAAAVALIGFMAVM